MDVDVNLMPDDPMTEWYRLVYIQFLINRFVYERANAFFYKRPGDDRKVQHRDVHIWNMNDVSFITTDFHKGKNFDFYCTTETYDWKSIKPQPTRFVGHEEWRKTVFMPAQEEQKGFVKGKDAVFEMDCAGHKGVTENWDKGKSVANIILDDCRSKGIKKMWMLFSGSGGFHGWVPWDELKRFYTGDLSQPLDLYEISEFTKTFFTDTVVSLGAKVIDGKLFLDGVELDIAPNTRRGLIRVPYSINPKTNNVVWPLTKKEFDDFTVSDVMTKFTIPYVLHNQKLKNREIPNILA